MNVKTKAGLLFLALGLAAVLFPLCGADTNSVAAIKWPSGSYFSAVHTNWPPLPYPPDDQLPVYDLGNGMFFVDDQGYVHPTPEPAPKVEFKPHLWFDTNFLAANPRRIQILRAMLSGPSAPNSTNSTNADVKTDMNTRATEEAISVLDFWTNHMSVLDSWTDRISNGK